VLGLCALWGSWSPDVTLKIAGCFPLLRGILALYRGVGALPLSGTMKSTGPLCALGGSPPGTCRESAKTKGCATKEKIGGGD
jgi:hypothetical protein